MEFETVNFPDPATTLGQYTVFVSPCGAVELKLVARPHCWGEKKQRYVAYTWEIVGYRKAGKRLWEKPDTLGK